MARRCAANGAIVGWWLAGNGHVAFCARGDGSACAVPVDRCARCVDDLHEGVDRMSSPVDDLQAAVDRCSRGVFDLHRPVFDSSRRVDHQHARDERFAPLHEAFAALRDARQVGMQICLQMGLQVGLQSDMDGRGEGACRTEARPTGAVGPGRMHQSGACCTAVGLFFALEPLVSREKPPGTMPAKWLLPAGSVVAGGIASANDGGTRERRVHPHLQPRCSNPTLIRVPRGP